MDIDKKDMMKRSSLPYPMELGSPSFFPIDAHKEKDILLNISKLNAKQEYERIMEQVAVLKKQADALSNRMQVSEIMHKCIYGFKAVHGKKYYVYYNSFSDENTLSLNGPNSWSAFPGYYTYIMTVRLMGDSTWEQIDDDD